MVWSYRVTRCKEEHVHVTKPEMGHWASLPKSIRSKKHPGECTQQFEQPVGPQRECLWVLLGYLRVSIGAAMPEGVSETILFVVENCSVSDIRGPGKPRSLSKAIHQLI